MDTSFDSPTETDPLIDKNSNSYSPAPNHPSSPFLQKSKSIFSLAVICILTTELCERLTFYGITANIQLFATEESQLNFSPAEASVLSYIFQGTCYVLPVLGGWLADSVAGKFSVIFFGSIIYLVGAAFVPLGTLNNVNEHIKTNNATLNNTTFKRAVYIIGLFLVAVGTGAIKANVSPFGAEQVSNRGQQAVQAFFAWFYWFINIGAFFAFTFVVYVQQEVAYFYGYLIPAGSMVITLVIFVAGKGHYQIRPPAGSPISKTVKIVKEAIQKLRRPVLGGVIVHHWLDRAKASFGGSYTNADVEDVKKVFRLIPIFGTFVLYWTIYAQMSTSFVYQGQYMDISLTSSFQIPVATLSILDTIGVLVLIPVMNKVVYPLLSKCNINLSQLQRIGIGMIITSLSMVCAGVLEMYRHNHCCILQDRGSSLANVSDLTIFYQVPQYTLIGLSEVFTSVTGLELAYSEAPKSLQGVVMGVFLLTSSLGSYLSAAIVPIVNAISGRHSKADEWYPGTTYINGGKLAYYFFLLAGLMVPNFIVYIFVAVSFKAKRDGANKNTNANESLNSTSHSIPSKATRGSENPP